MNIKTLLIPFSVLILVVVLLGAVDWWGQLPKPSFSRHFGSPIPRSVAITSKWGCTGLAGSSEFIVFSIAPADLEKIISARNMKPIELSGDKAGFYGTNQMVYATLLEEDMAIARTKAINPVRAFANSQYEGMVYNLILVDTNGMNVLYHYFKM